MKFPFKITVPYRRYRYVSQAPGKFELVISKEYKKLMKMIQKFDNVEFVHEIVANSKWWCDGAWYDKVTVEIND